MPAAAAVGSRSMVGTSISNRESGSRMVSVRPITMLVNSQRASSNVPGNSSSSGRIPTRFRAICSPAEPVKKILMTHEMVPSKPILVM